MKTNFTLFLTVGLIISSGSLATAGNIDNKHNWSVEYIRTLNRNAATDSADIVAYNPAGTMKMENGAYLNLSMHTVYKDYINTVDNSQLKSDTPSIVPGFFALYKQDRWSGFFGVTIPSGGGKVDFENGNKSTRVGGRSLINLINAGAGAAVYDTIKNEYVEAESYYYGLILGGAYKINDMFSVSLAGRYVDAQREFKGTLDLQPSALGAFVGQVDRRAVLDYEDSADGWGGIIGVNISPTDALNIGMRYETETHLDFEYEVHQDTVTDLPSGLGAGQGITNGTKHRRDLPALLGLGLSHQCTPKFRVETNLTYYFNEDADWGGDENDVDNGYDVGLAIEYIVTPKFKASLGYMHTNVEMDAADIQAEAPQLGANTVAGGFVYKHNEDLDFNFALGKVYYLDKSYLDTSSGTPIPVIYDKDIIFLGFGVQYKFL